MIEVISFFYNEEYLLPFYLNHYAYADKITAFYDEDSTDNTLKILKNDPKVRVFPFKFIDGLNETEKIYMINKAYRKSKAKYCIIADADEFVFKPRFMFRNMYFCKLWQMVGKDRELTIDAPIKVQLCSGYYDKLYLKPSIVKTGKRYKFKEGHHSVTRFHVKKYPFFNTVEGMHLNMLSWKFYKNRMLDRFTRQSQYNKDKGFSHQFTNRSGYEIARKYMEALGRRRRLW